MEEDFNEELLVRFPFPPNIMRRLTNDGWYKDEEIEVSLDNNEPLKGEQLKIMNALLDLYEKKSREDKNGQNRMS